MIETEELKTLIPHRGPMLLLSAIKEYNTEEKTLNAEYHITRDCLFYDPAIGGVPAWVAFEFMAQSISSLSGLRSREKGEGPKMGFLLSVSSMKIGIPFFKEGCTVELRIKESSRVDQIYNFDGEAFLEGRKVINGRLTIFDADDEQVKLFMNNYE